MTGDTSVLPATLADDILCRQWSSELGPGQSLPFPHSSRLDVAPILPGLHSAQSHDQKSSRQAQGDLLLDLDSSVR